MKKANMSSRQGGSQGSLNGGNRNTFSIKALNSVQNQNCSASANMSLTVGDANITAPNKKVMPHPMLRPKGIISGLTINSNGGKNSQKVTNSIDMSSIVMGANNSSNNLSTKVRASIADKKQQQMPQTTLQRYDSADIMMHVNNNS